MGHLMGRIFMRLFLWHCRVLVGTERSLKFRRGVKRRFLPVSLTGHFRFLTDLYARANNSVLTPPLWNYKRCSPLGRRSFPFLGFFSSELSSSGCALWLKIKKKPSAIKAQLRPRSEYSYISQNVLGVANFDLTIGYALFGWKGSAHDSRVLDDALARGLFLIPEKYYLGDRYGPSKYSLTPYRGVCYHLVEFDLNGHGPATSKELFNYVTHP